jgi:UDP-N-acetylglucosamine--N-acetylmuramyl-(pentapeptide) pyrophosphoryl-undecaprenol N-acetylglucosamine transferase
MAKLKKVLIMAGGTGGHIFPGLAVAELLREENIEVHWLGTQKGLESRLVSEAQFPLHFINISGLRGKGVKALFLAPFRLLRAISQAVQVIKSVNPDIVIGMGGFVSGPGGIASWLLRCPLIIHEQNAKAGLTNKWLARIASKVLEGFPDTFDQGHKIITTGNPVRIEIAQLPSRDGRSVEMGTPLNLLVLGGSLGAAAINELLPRALAQIPDYARPKVYHQTGEKHLETTVQAYQAAGVEARVTAFIADMGQAYEWADIVLCRAGASTIAELCAAGLASILVPYPYAVDDHQTANANYLVKHQAAVLIQQAVLTEEMLARILNEMSSAPARREAMGMAAYQLRKLDATKKVYEICGEICR